MVEREENIEVSSLYDVREIIRGDSQFRDSGRCLTMIPVNIIFRPVSGGSYEDVETGIAIFVDDMGVIIPSVTAASISTAWNHISKWGGGLIYGEVFPVDLAIFLGDLHVDPSDYIFDIRLRLDSQRKLEISKEGDALEVEISEINEDRKDRTSVFEPDPYSLDIIGSTLNEVEMRVDSEERYL